MNNMVVEQAKQEIVNSINNTVTKYKLPMAVVLLMVESILNQIQQLRNVELNQEIEEYKKQEDKDKKQSIKEDKDVKDIKKKTGNTN